MQNGESHNLFKDSRRSCDILQKCLFTAEIAYRLFAVQAVNMRARRSSGMEESVVATIFVAVEYVWCGSMSIDVRLMRVKFLFREDVATKTAGSELPCHFGGTHTVALDDG